MKRFYSFALMLLVAAGVALPLPGFAAEGSTVTARILDQQGGLPIPGATVELDRAGARVATAQTNAYGTATFSDVAPGTYIVYIRANGYQTARVSPDLLIAAGIPEVGFQTAISRANGLKTIGYVTTAGRVALQTSSTINTPVDTSLMQSENYQRLGDLLTTVPGVTTFTSSSVGDDMSLSIRGFDSTETATLLDGHPIGPIGAYGGGYNYNVSPFWGLSGTDVVFGSGASGLYGATTIAGAVNFESISPTRDPHYSVTQGVGTNDKLMTGFLGTGTVGNLGYAFAWGVQGTNGNFPGGNITQTALLQGSATHVNCANPAQPNSKACQNTLLNPAPDLTAANVNNNLNTYWVTGQYSQYNFVGKVKYDFAPRTSLQLTAFSATDWSNSTGEGDNDYQTYPYALYGAQQTISGNGKSGSQVYVNGRLKTCHDTIAVLTSTASGYSCFTAKQFATDFYGPFGGGIDRWRSLGNQDYDARINQGLGIGTITLEGFVDAYNYNLQKGPGAVVGVATPYGPGPYYLNLYKNRGYLISDDIPWSKNDLGFGYSWLRESINNGFSTTNNAGTAIAYFSYNPELYLATGSYFVRDTWTPNDRLQMFANVWLQRSHDTATTYFDPRLSAVYHLTPADVVRATAGRSYSEPDPSLLALAPPVYGAPTSVNCPSSTTGSGALTSIASEADPNLKAETANDIELAYGHRFNSTTNIQADLYQSWEGDALLGGNIPITQIPQVTVPQHLIDQYLARLSKCPGLNPTEANLAFSTTFNASGARYRGIVLSTNVGITREVQFNASYNVQSAAYVGVPQDILQDNTGLLDGGQIYGIPLHQATAGLSYQNRTGFGARIDTTYVGDNNSWNRPAFWFANGSVSQASADGKTVVTLGINNIFNSAAQQYGLIGYGVYQPQNYYGLGPASGLTQGQEEYGLPFRQYWLTVKVGI